MGKRKIKINLQPEDVVLESLKVDIPTTSYIDIDSNLNVYLPTQTKELLKVCVQFHPEDWYKIITYANTLSVLDLEATLKTFYPIPESE